MAFVPDTPSKFVPDAPPDPSLEATKAAAATEHGPIQDVVDMIRAVPSGLVPALKGIVGQVTNPYGTVLDMAHGVQKLIADPQGALAAVKGATPAQVGKNVVAPMVAGGALTEGASALAGAGDASAAALAEAASPAGQLGFRSTVPHPVARVAAGSTAGPTLSAQNQAVGATVLGADAGVPHGVPINPTSLEAARAKPGQLLNDAAAQIPTAPLSPVAAQLVKSARPQETLMPGSPDVQKYVDATEARLTSGNPITGEEVRATRTLATQEAAAASTSADPAQRALAKYKRAIADAMDQHVADSLPPNSAISPEMIGNARATLAKNYNLQDLIGKGGDIDLQALAADHRANPNKFTGNTRIVAQFAHEHPEVTAPISNADRIAPPSLLTDVGHINVINPRSWFQPMIGAPARRALTGPSGAALEAAQKAPVAGLGGEFDHLPLTELHTPGAVGPAPSRQVPLPLGPEPHSGPPLPVVADLHNPPGPSQPAAAGPPGQIPLADLLSHGVEQPPAAGLSLASGAPSVPTGIPFARNAAHEAGDLGLADQLAPAARENNTDLAKVASQGVPEDIVQRTAAAGPRPKVAHSPAFVNQNASGESAASLEAQGRVKEGLAQGVQPIAFGADDVARPMSPHDVGRADLKPAPNEIFINAKDGTIINSGNMAPRLAQGMLARWKALHGPGSLQQSF